MNPQDLCDKVSSSPKKDNSVWTVVSGLLEDI